MTEGRVGLWKRHGDAIVFLWSVGGGSHFAPPIAPRLTRHELSAEMPAEKKNLLLWNRLCKLACCWVWLKMRLGEGSGGRCMLVALQSDALEGCSAWRAVIANGMTHITKH